MKLIIASLTPALAEIEAGVVAKADQQKQKQLYPYPVNPKHIQPKTN